VYSKKRTPARASKLVADIYLFSGKLELAITTFLTAIESMKTTQDYYWHAAALESYYSALILYLLKKSGVREWIYGLGNCLYDLLYRVM
jgi:hypothetical protein